MSVGRRERWALALVTAAFALALGLWAVLVPPFQAPDEPAHFDSAVHVALGDPWVAPGDQQYLAAVRAATDQADPRAVAPTDRSTIGELLASHPGTEPSSVDQMTQHPATAYVLQAAVLRAVGYQDMRWDHALLVLRLFDALLVLPVPVLAWAAVRRITRSPRAAVVGAAAVLAVPEVASIGASVTNDALAIVLGALVTAVLARVLTGDRRTGTLLVLGVSLGCLILTKGTGLPAVPVVGVGLLIGPGPVGVHTASRGVPALGTRVVQALGTLAVAAAVGGWWWVRNLVLYGTLQPNGYAAVRPPADFPPGQGPSVRTFLDVSWGTVIRTFWGSFGGNAGASMSPWLLVPLTVVVTAVIVVWGFRRGPERRGVIVLALLPVLLLAAQTVTSITGYLTTTVVGGTQGRYLFPGLVALVVISAVAWRRIPRPQHGRAVLPVAVTGLALAMAAAGLLTARLQLVPTSGYAVWSGGLPGSAVVGAVGASLVVVGAAALVAVARLPGPRDPAGAPGPVQPPR